MTYKVKYEYKNQNGQEVTVDSFDDLPDWVKEGIKQNVAKAFVPLLVNMYREQMAAAAKKD